MVRAVVQSDLVFSEEQVEKITAHFSITDDTCREVPDDQPALFKLESDEGVPFPLFNKRPLTQFQADRAVDYIRACVTQYPFNIRWSFALPMWQRFSETWDSTGDIEKSLKDI